MTLPAATLDTFRARHAIAVHRGSAMVRWYAIALAGVVGLIQPPPAPALLAAWMVGMGVYNSVVLWSAPRFDAEGARRALCRLVPLDTLSLFILLGIYAGAAQPESLYALGVWILLEAVFCADIRGVVVASGLFGAGVLALQVARFGFFQQNFEAGEALGWPLMIATTGVSLVMVQRMFLGSAASTAAQPAAVPASAKSDGVRLTRREGEVLGLVAQGLSNAMIASRLHVSQSTVKSHVDSLLHRLDAHTRAEAVAVGARLNLF